jgi:hypothetical protein
MAVSISNTKHYKKGDKLPDGSIAKRGVVYNTQTGRPVTGKVMMSAAGQGGMGAIKSYKGGRSVAAMKKSTSKPAPKSRGNGGGGSGSKSTPSAAQTARDARLQQNKGVKGGTVRVGAAGRSVRKYNAKTGRWDRVATRTGSGSRSATSATVSSATAAAKSRKPSRSATSGTVSSAIAAGNAKGKQFSTRSPLSVKGFGERVGISLGRAAMTAAKARKILAEGASVHSDSVLNAARKFIEGK